MAAHPIRAEILLSFASMMQYQGNLDDTAFQKVTTYQAWCKAQLLSQIRNSNNNFSL